MVVIITNCVEEFVPVPGTYFLFGYEVSKDLMGTAFSDKPRVESPTVFKVFHENRVFRQTAR